jgi:hypothetical protein
MTAIIRLDGAPGSYSTEKIATSMGIDGEEYSSISQGAAADPDRNGLRYPIVMLSYEFFSIVVAAGDTRTAQCARFRSPEVLADGLLFNVVFNTIADGIIAELCARMTPQIFRDLMGGARQEMAGHHHDGREAYRNELLRLLGFPTESTLHSDLADR